MIKSGAKSNLQTIEINGIHIALLRSSRRKRLALEVGRSGVKVRAPERMREQTIRQFIRSKEPWIRYQMANRPAIVQPIALCDGSEVKLLDKTYQLHITNGRNSIHIDEFQRIVIPITRSHLPIEDTIRRKLEKWFKQVALLHLELRVKNRLSEMLPGRGLPKILVRNYSRRWGSCNHRGQLSFNWRIVMAPDGVLDYIVVHELAHLAEFNHSRRFWKLVELQVPDWRKHQQWLADYGGTLYRF